MGDWVVEFINRYSYLGVAFLMFAETVFPPIPSEVIMPVGGLAAARGGMSLSGVIAAGTAGAMLGNLFWYLLARAIGIHRLHPLIDRFGRWLTMDWDEVVRGQKWFAQYGAAFVFFGRLLPTVRSLVSVPAGLLSMRILYFTIWSTLGTAGWTALLAFAGYKLGQNYAEIDNWVGPASKAIIVVLVGWYLFRVATWNWRRR